MGWDQMPSLPAVATRRSPPSRQRAGEPGLEQTPAPASLASVPVMRRELGRPGGLRGPRLSVFSFVFTGVRGGAASAQQ